MHGVVSQQIEIFRFSEPAGPSNLLRLASSPDLDFMAGQVFIYFHGG